MNLWPFHMNRARPPKLSPGVATTHWARTGCPVGIRFNLPSPQSSPQCGSPSWPSSPSRPSRTNQRVGTCSPTFVLPSSLLMVFAPPSSFESSELRPIFLSKICVCPLPVTKLTILVLRSSPPMDVTFGQRHHLFSNKPEPVTPWTPNPPPVHNSRRTFWLILRQTLP